jgi:L-alanine-DL-glutamate epimerase-like enolase superfamily enzyme
MQPPDVLRRDWEELPLTIERKTVTHMVRANRTTAIVHLEGGGESGYGEEVTFQGEDLLPVSLQMPWRFTGSFREFSLWLAVREVFERVPEFEVVRNYRQWAFEAAALDLALRQAGLRFDKTVGRTPEPVEFVASPAPGFGDFPPEARLKIDAVDLRPDLPVDVVDFKGSGDRAAVESALALYPDALLEDPPVVVSGARVSWDLSITSAEEIRRLSDRPSAINVKPARLGGMAALFDVYELCVAEGIETYGGGQHELGPGRAQIQLLASLFHPHAPNDVAPSAYNEPEPRAGLPTSPLEIEPRVGFGTA